MTKLYASLGPAIRVSLALSLLFTASIFSAGCRLQGPPGWQDRGAREVIAPLVVLEQTWAPRHWRLADGREALVRVRAFSREGAPLGHRPQTSFSVELKNHASSRIECTTRHSSGPRHLVCRGVASNAALGLGNQHDCAEQKTMFALRSRPNCFVGRAQIDQHTFFLQYGTGKVAGFEGPIAQLSWIDDANQPRLAVSVVRENAIELYPIRPVAKPAATTLRLFTIALSWWEHASRRALNHRSL